MEEKNESRIKRIGGYLHKVIPIADKTGKVIHYTIAPLMFELRPRDVLQIIVGATVLAIPVGLTEETWILAKEINVINVTLLGIISVFFVALFVYYNFYRFYLKGHAAEYIKRVIATYGLSLLIVGLLLTLIEKCPWGIDNILAIKRIVITTLPASMAATISDNMR